MAIHNNQVVLPFVPLEFVGVTDFERGVAGFSSSFLFDGVDAFDDVPDLGECGPIRSRSLCSIFFINSPFSRGEDIPLLLCTFGIGLIGLTSDASSTTRS